MMILSRTRRVLCLSAALSTLLVLSGCGLQGTAGPSADTGGSLLGLQGRAMGGNSPIVGATVTLYATAVNTTIANGTYVGTATPLGTTTTIAGGFFTFGTVSSCAANSLVYVTLAGGNTGGGTNANELLGSVYGICGTVNGSSFVVVNEASTIAMAYAFSSFTSIDGSGNVNITAPVANSHLTSNVVGSGTVTAASGLYHAYNNFLNLVTPLTGAALAVPVTNSSGIAPQAVVNSLANILQACVNSTGGTEGDSSNCGKVFADTPAIGGAFPTNTFQAALNLARNPYVSSANVTSLFGLITGIGSGVYLPSLSSAPNDWTLAIKYPVPANPGTGNGFPFTVALDFDDNVYITSPENDPYATNGTIAITRTSGSACLFGYSSSGTLLPTVVPYSGTPAAIGAGTAAGGATAGSSTWYCAYGAPVSGPTPSNNTLLTQLAPDALGNIWVVDVGTTSTFASVLQINTSTPSSATAYVGSAGVTPKTIAVDKSNDVFTTPSSSTCVLNYITAGGASGTTMKSNGLVNGESSLTQAANWIALDSTQNIWATYYGDTNVPTSGEPNYVGDSANILFNGTTYATSWNKAIIDGASGTSQQENADAYGVAIDGSGIGWYTTAAFANGGTNTRPPALTKADTTGGAANAAVIAGAISLSGTTYGFVAPKWLEADGNNVMWIADTGGIIACTSSDSGNSGTGSCTMISEPGGFRPCLAGSATTCTYPDNTNTKGIAVDSTGSVWYTTPDTVTSTANSNDLVQIIGTGTATWPLLATGKPGTMPQ